MLYTCRYLGCSRSKVSFSSKKDREDHEMTHLIVLICEYPDCKYGLKFKSKRALQHHININHGPDLATIARRTFQDDNKQIQDLPPNSTIRRAFQDYEMQLMLLDMQKKERLMMSKQE